MKYDDLAKVIAAYNYSKKIVKEYNKTQMAVLFGIDKTTMYSYGYRGFVPDIKIIEFAQKHSLNLNYIYGVKNAK